MVSNNITRFQIHTPIWASSSVGLNEKRIFSDTVEFEILYKDRKGRRIYPYMFRVKSSHVFRCPRQIVKGVPLRIVKLADCEQLGRQVAIKG